jgi:hypothetical protein
MADGGHRAPDDPTDAQIEEGLRAVPADLWNELWKAFDAIDPAGDHTSWEGGQQTGSLVVDGVEKPVHQVPYAVYSGELDRLVRAISAAGLIVPFAWPDWDGIRRYRDGHGLADAPVADAVRMVTAIVRSERFTEGSIGGALAGGTLPAALRRIRRWRSG